MSGMFDAVYVWHYVVAKIMLWDADKEEKCNLNLPKNFIHFLKTIQNWSAIFFKQLRFDEVRERDLSAWAMR